MIGITFSGYERLKMDLDLTLKVQGDKAENGDLLFRNNWSGLYGNIWWVNTRNRLLKRITYVMFNIHDLQWDWLSFLEMLTVPKEHASRVRPSSEIYGETIWLYFFGQNFTDCRCSWWPNKQH